MELQKFSQLEEKIKKIVSEKVSLKKQIQILEEALRNKEAELVGLKNNTARLIIMFSPTSLMNKPNASAMTGNQAEQQAGRYWM